VTTTQHPATEAITAACKKTLTSAAFVKFMHHAVQSALAETQAHGTTLPTLAGKKCDTRFVDIHEGIKIKTNCGAIEIFLYRDRSNPNKQPKGLWYGSEYRTDSNGIQWSRCLPYMVQDDFGTLVEVPA